MFVLKYIEKYTPECYMEWHKSLMTYTGLLPPKNPVGRSIYLCLTSLHLVFVLSSIGLEYVEFEKNFGLNFKDTVLIVSQIALKVMTFAKVIYFLVFSETYLAAFDIVERGTFNFENYEAQMNSEDYLRMVRTFKFDSYDDLKEAGKFLKIHYGNRRHEAEEYQKKYMKKIRTFCFALCVSLMSSTISTLISSYYITIFSSESVYDSKRNETISAHKLPYKMYVPYEMTINRKFWLFCFYQCYTFIYALVGFFGVHMATVNSLILLSGQVHVICDVIRSVDGNDEDESEIIKQIKFVRCNEQLQEILKAVEILEELTNPLLVFQYTLSVLYLSGLLCVIEEIETKVELFTTSSTVGLSLIEILITCIAAQYLTTQCENVVFAVYDLNWLRYSIPFRKKIVFMMARFNKPIVLTVGKTFIFNPEFATAFMRMMYSVYTLTSQTKK